MSSDGSVWMRAAFLLALTGTGACAANRTATRCPSLSDSRSSWKRLTADDCDGRERIWGDLRRCMAGYGKWLPDVQTIGDCWIGRGNADRATAFYATLTPLPSSVECTKEGVSCASIARAEIRRLGCGSAWLADSEEQAWRRFTADVSAPSHDVGAGALEPDVWAGDETSTECPPDAFAIPESIRRHLSDVRQHVESQRVSWGARQAWVPIDGSRDEWRRTALRVYSHYHLRVCPQTRPAVGRASGGWAIQIAVVHGPSEEAACQSSAR